eukprot:Colp12_sorted_trinity150504_noHs@6779
MEQIVKHLSAIGNRERILLGVGLGSILISIGIKRLFKKLTTKVYPAINSGHILITGASTGLGAHASIYLAEKGFTVFAAVRKTADGEALKKKAGAVGDKIIPVIIDVTKKETIEEAAAFVTSKVGKEGLVGLVNNAGIITCGPLEFQPLDDVRWQFEVNVFGQVAVTQAFLPLVRLARGRIVNMSSLAGLVASPMMGAYAMSKHALEAYSDALRRELAPWNISVSTINPGYIESEIIRKADEGDAAILDKLPPNATKWYGPYFNNRKKGGIPPSLVGQPILVSEAVHHALTSRTPKTGYLVGTKEIKKKVLLIPYLPKRITDNALTRSVWPRKFKIEP